MPCFSIERVVCLLTLCGLLTANPADAWESPPDPPREFRGVWVATVANIDWPSAPGLPSQQQRDELTRLLDAARDLKLNAVLLQVRPACDALYPSELEPWSEFLTGRMGEDGPAYDPLAFAIEEAHARGLQLHAWLNPYRARHTAGKGEPSEDHVSRRIPDAVVEYGDYLWLDPGSPEAVAHSLAVVADLLQRYDLDGVHFDDYFYPYPVTVEEPDEVTEGQTEDGADDAEQKTKKEVPFPDDRSWNAYLQTAGDDPMSRDEWRRDNVNRFIQAVYRTVHRVKPHAQFGVSPFGIWRPGHPESIKGFDAYDKLYADSRLWLREGWVDYLAPQLYWPIESEGQSFPTLLDWWKWENVHRRGLWPGLYTSKLGPPDDADWEASEILEQIKIARGVEPSCGTIHFSAKALAGDWSGLGTELREGLYAHAALPPRHPTAPKEVRTRVRMSVEYSTHEGMLRIAPEVGSPEAVAYWVLQTRHDAGWKTTIAPGSDRLLTVPADGVIEFSLRGVNRFGDLSPPRISR